MKEKTTHIKNKYTKSNIIDIISMVILIYIICHFLIVVPMFYTGSNDSIFRKLYLIRSFVLAAPVQLWYILAKYKEYKDNKKNSTYIKVSGIEYF